MTTAKFTVQLAVPQWLEIPQETRNKLKKLFDIPRSSGTIINAHKVVSDGHTFQDLAVITVQRMQDYLGKGFEDDTNFFDLFENVLEKLKDDETTIAAKEEKKVETENIALWLMRLSEMKRDAIELGLLEQFTKLINDTYGVQPVQIKKGAGRPRKEA